MANSIVVSIAADTRNLASGVNRAKKDVRGLGTATVSTGSVIKGALTGAAVIGGLNILKNKFKEAFNTIQQQQVIANQTAAVIKSTGGAAHVSAKGLVSYADAMERKTLFDSEAIQSGENVLLTFTNIRNEAGKGNDIFKQTSDQVLNLSQAMGTPVKNSAVLLGKALNDPVKGVTALTRVGVTFTQQQKDQIKALEDSGQHLKAQKVILGEVNKEFGGSATAAGSTAAGAFKHLQDIVDGAFEAILKKALPVLVTVADFLSKELPRDIAAAQPYVDKLQSAFGTLKDKLQPVITFLKNNPQTVRVFAVTLLVLAAAVKTASLAMAILNAVMEANPITLVVLAIAALAAGFYYAYTHSTKFRTIVIVAFNVVKAAAQRVFPIIKTIIVTAFKVASAYVKFYVNVIKTVIRIAWAVIRTTTKVAWAVIKYGIITPIRFAFNVVKSVVRAIKNAVTSSFNAARAVTSRVWNGIKGVVSGAVNGLLHIVSGIKGRVSGALSGAGGLLVGAGKAIIQGLINGVDSLINTFLGKLRSLTKLIPKVKGPASKDKVLLKPAGQLIIQGLIAGLEQEIPNVYKTLTKLTNGVGGFSSGLNSTITVDGTAAATAAGGTTVINLTVNAPVGSNPAAIGKELAGYLDQYIASGGAV